MDEDVGLIGVTGRAWCVYQVKTEQLSVSGSSSSRIQVVI
jgi:hypothetical protein